MKEKITYRANIHNTIPVNRKTTEMHCLVSNIRSNMNIDIPIASKDRKHVLAFSTIMYSADTSSKE